MNCTNIDVLKLLKCSKLSQKELSLYLNVEEKSITKNICQLNNELEYSNLNTIKLDNGKYSLNLSKSEWKLVFCSKEFLSAREITDYLYIKFIANGCINLEFERNEFQISRSTINRYFSNVKKILNRNKSKYEIDVGKGLKLISLSEEDKNIFCKKIIQLIIKFDFSFEILHTYENIFEKYKLQATLEQIYEIFILEEIVATKISLAFCLALKICVETFGGFKVFEVEAKNEIKAIKDKKLENCSRNYKNQLISFLSSTQKKITFFEKDIEDFSKCFLINLKRELQIDLIEENYEKLLLTKIAISFFKYNNKILDVDSFELKKSDIKILEILKKILKKNNLKMYTSDLIVIGSIIKKILIEHNKKEIKTILLVSDEIDLLNDIYLKENLKRNIENVKFDIKSIFHLKLNFLKNVEKYDLILGCNKDEELKIEKISLFNHLGILEKIEQESLKKALADLKF